ncbi:MAG: DUF4242 domain-containing protein [Anaerolineae bacterium]|nr:DUF4242 domain-containing protein [Anaerolineae bacterium]
MPRYLVIHSTAGLTDQEEAVAGARRLARSLPPESKWLNSWLALEKAKMFCEWEAPDTDTLLDALEPVMESTPVEAIYEVAVVDPAWYKE